MIQRIKQFYLAITARIKSDDRKWVQEILTDKAQQLFYAMHPADQYHALNVARTALALWEKQPAGDRNLLLRSALLHDVGKMRGDMDVFGKVWAVLLKHFLPGLALKLALNGTGYLGHIMYISYNHAQIGAEKLQHIGMVQEAEIIRYHHAQPKENEPPELKLLRAADELN